MKERLKVFLIGACSSVILIGSVSFAAQYSDTVQRFYNNIKISLNGTEITPKDINGNVVEPFIIDGTTYLPVRAVGNALGLNVDWNGETNTVILSNEPIQKEEEVSYEPIEDYSEKPISIIVSTTKKEPTYEEEGLIVGKSIDLDVCYYDRNIQAVPKVEWSSNNTSIAEVDQNGVVTAKSKGKVHISAMSTGGWEDTYILFVVEPTVKVYDYVEKCLSSSYVKKGAKCAYKINTEDNELSVIRYLENNKYGGNAYVMINYTTKEICYVDVVSNRLFSYNAKINNDMTLTDYTYMVSGKPLEEKTLDLNSNSGVKIKEMFEIEMELQKVLFGIENYETLNILGKDLNSIKKQTLDLNSIAQLGIYYGSVSYQYYEDLMGTI